MPTFVADIVETDQPPQKAPPRTWQWRRRWLCWRRPVQSGTQHRQPQAATVAAINEGAASEPLAEADCEAPGGSLPPPRAGRISAR
jgi:hypothetical protein